MLKPDPMNVSAHSPERKELAEDGDVLQTCLDLKSTADRLYNQVKNLQERVETLKAEVTNVKQVVHQLELKCDKAEQFPSNTSHVVLDASPEAKPSETDPVNTQPTAGCSLPKNVTNKLLPPQKGEKENVDDEINSKILTNSAQKSTHLITSKP